MPLTVTGYNFFKDSMVIANNSTSDRLTMPSLSITNAGNYFCTYNRYASSSSPESHHIDLKVIERPSAPTLLLSPERNVFVVNQSVVIRCFLPGRPDATEINLYQNGAIIYGSDNLGVLSLASTEKRNTGNYTCEYKIVIAGRTVDSHPSNEATLVVIDLPPTPVLRHAYSLQNNSREVEITCEIPNPFSSIHGYRLYRNGGEVSSSQGNRFVKNYSLEFDGCYYCRSFVKILREEILSRKSDEVFLTLEERSRRSCQTQNSASGYDLSNEGIKLYGSILIGKVIVLISILLIFGLYLLVLHLSSQKSQSEE
ncbi:hypothetical protein GDO78_007076 [Eleutherodactylus coqui]|uniref:Ig-like domain-containing protein n=1 Tax=Eleutherodactylus coqui TaxID=57060 RepID=A0A8J6KCV2_ELECQ|nr:hypothetical protein GDO78_007076 [Eleutherodactylus coqui]